MNTLTVRIKELRLALQVKSDSVARKQVALEEAQEAEYFIAQELNLAIRDCDHELVFSIEENFMNEEGFYDNNEIATAYTTCAICGQKKFAKLRLQDFGG